MNSPPSSSLEVGVKVAQERDFHSSIRHLLQIASQPRGGGGASWNPPVGTQVRGTHSGAPPSSRTRDKKKVGGAGCSSGAERGGEQPGNTTAQWSVVARARGWAGGHGQAVRCHPLTGDLGRVSGRAQGVPSGCQDPGRLGGVTGRTQGLGKESGGQRAQTGAALTHRAPLGRPCAAASAEAASPPCRPGSSPGPGTRTCSWSGSPAWCPARLAGAWQPHRHGQRLSERASEPSLRGPASGPAPGRVRPRRRPVRKQRRGPTAPPCWSASRDHVTGRR